MALTWAKRGRARVIVVVVVVVDGLGVRRAVNDLAVNDSLVSFDSNVVGSGVGC